MIVKKNKTTDVPCPCGGASYTTCCALRHQQHDAATAEILMRSRYSAFVLRQADYLLASWHPSTRPPMLDLEETPAPQWLGLTIVAHAQQDDSHATVEFIARYKLNGRACRLHETSRFVREDGHWLYVDGDIHA